MTSIRVVRILPGDRPSLATMENSVEGMQKLVGGYVESHALGNGLQLLCDEDGRAKALPLNRFIPGRDIAVGPLVVVRVSKAGDFINVTDADLKAVKMKF